MSFSEDQTWDLESIWPGGLDGQAFQAHLGQLQARVAAIRPLADALGPVGDDDAWFAVLPTLVDLEREVQEVWSFVGCHVSADTDAPAAGPSDAILGELGAALHRAWTVPTHHIGDATDAAYAALCAAPALASMTPRLETARAQARLSLPLEQQQLLDELADDAFHAWGQVYRRVSARLRVQFQDQALSISQARNRMELLDGPDRQRLSTATDRAWQSVDEPVGNALSRIVGFRRTLHSRLGVDELAIPLSKQRIQRETLDALRQACLDSRPLLWRYLAAKARLLGREHLDTWDLRAAVGAPSRSMSWSDAVALVVGQVRTFSPEMGDFFAMALERRWVEAADRPAKRAGAFCASFPVRQESRVFMTFGGGPSSVRTLAHELGHAYHNHVLRELPYGERAITSCLAETASTFAETVVRQAMLAAAPTAAERVALVDRDLADATVFLLQLMERFDLERRLFALRAAGPLRPAELCELSEEIQRTWYGDALGAAEPRRWASTLHFFLTRQPFYNFPYTFGYLFSTMVHQRATQEGPAWAETYRQLLVDTRRGPAEDLAMRYLGVDLRRVEAWLAPIRALEPLVAELEAA